MSKIGRPVYEEEFTPRPLPEPWTVGGGAEMPIGQIASLRLEYLFTKFASISTSENKIFPLITPAGATDFPCGADGGAFGGGMALPR